MARSKLANLGLSSNTRSTYPRRTVRPMEKEMEAAMAAEKRQVAVPEDVPKR